LLGLVGVLILSACAEIGDPDLGEGVTGPSTTAGSVADESADPDSTAVSEVVSAQVSPVFAPTRSDDYVPLVLASTSSGIVAMDETGELTPLGPLFGSTSVVMAVDDYFGGIVGQSDDGVVLWLPANTTETQLVSQGNGTLLDVGFIDDTLAAQVFLDVGGAVDRIKLVDGGRESFAQLGPGEELIAFSSSNGIQAMALRDADCGSLRFLNASGQAVDLGGPDSTSCPVQRRPRFGAVALSPDGGTVAYTEISYRGDGLPASTQLIAVELGSGALLISEQVGGAGEQIESLAYDGRRLTFLRTGETGRQVTLLAVSSPGESFEVTIEGVQQVSFARLPLAVSRPEPDVEEPIVDPPADG